MIESAVKRKGARIVSAAGEGTDSDSPADVLMRRMVDAFAEYERLIIGARTKSALQAKKARGERTGSIPYGYRCDDGVNLVPDEQEQNALALIKELNSKGLSLRNIAGRLEAKGYKPRNGKSWHPQTISNILEAA
jgi:DNA invertase Pin-like site-specific DNA recombinase